MNSIQFPYTELSSAALIAIFRLADLLEVTPKRASEIYLTEKARKANSKEAA